MHKPLLLIVLFLASITPAQSQLNLDSLWKVSKELLLTNEKEAINNFETCLQYYYVIKDTTSLIKKKFQLLHIFAEVGKYQHTYKYAWRLFPLLEQEQYAEKRAQLLLRLSGLCVKFGQFGQAEQYLEATATAIQKLKNDTLKELYQGRIYSKKAWILTKSGKNYTEAEEYLQKYIVILESVNASKANRLYAKTQAAELYMKMYRTDEAKALLRDLQKEVTDSTTNINILINLNLGNYYYKRNQLDSAIYYLRLSATQADAFHSYTDKKIESLDLLTTCYTRQNAYQKALTCILESKKLNDKVFGTKSKLNVELFEIKDDYASERKSIIAKVKNQRLSLLEKEQELWYYKLVAYLFLFIITIILLIAYFAQQKRKLNNDKLLLQKEKALEKQQQEEVIEVKNKELMTSALQQLERDSALNDLSKTITNLPDDEITHEIKKQMNAIKLDRSQKWDEFEVYYTSVNSQFHNLLREKYPKLTASDLKICAFIKLGFSTKDMAETIGIGHNSVNTARSRIRKKMGLAREVNISEYLQKIE